MPSVDVIFAGSLKPGDLYAGRIDPDAPTMPVQPFAHALKLATVERYTGEDGRKMLDLRAVGLEKFPLEPVSIGVKVLVIRP